MNNISELQGLLDSLDSEWVLYIKRLSANDTGLTGGHQVGVYIPREAGKQFLPGIQRIDTKNPELFITTRVDSHSLPEQTVRAVYYNNKHSENVKNGRDEQRLTQWKTGVGATSLQDVDNTGALCVFAFHFPPEKDDTDYLRVWVCRNIEEEDHLEGLVGEVVPGGWLCGRFDALVGGMFSLPLTTEKIINTPDEWDTAFPTGKEIIEFVVKNYREEDLLPDKRLLKRRRHEFAVFRAIEDKHLLDLVGKGFDSVDSFIAVANSVSNRRKSRSGNSLELHLECIFLEEGLKSFGTQCVTESRKKPDFLFPSCEKYHDPEWPAEMLRMLAVKTTCKDRWRQILNEANRIETPHLLTLQEGVSENQHREMESEGVKLVVPKPLHKKYPKGVREKLTSLDEFIRSTATLYL